MDKIKLLNKNSNLKHIKKLNWDTYIRGVYYDVYRINEYIHSIGGQWGEDCYWACKRGETPSYKNLVEFTGHVCSWSLLIEETNYLKTKYEETEIRNSIHVKILRNDKVFYSFTVRDFEYGYAKARKLMIEIPEHPISFNEIDFENQIIGREILWRGQKCKIIEYSMNENLIIEPINNKECIAEDIFSEQINWSTN